MKKVFCIVVTYNGMQWLDRCLRSLLSGSYKVTVIVIDNASTDGSAAFVKEYFPSVHILAKEKNAGFGQANNAGIAIAIDNAADYVFLLNQDAWVEPDTIADLVAVHLENPDAGIISPLHLNGSGTALDKYFEQYLREAKIKVEPSSLINTAETDVIPVPFVNAAAWLVSAACLRSVGGFDPIFFHYGEDVNYTQRTLHKGFSILVYTGACICHDRESRTSVQSSQTILSLKREWTFFLQHACDVERKNIIVFIFKRFVRHLLFSIGNMLTGKTALARFHFDMARNIIKSFPQILRSRRIVVNGREFSFLNIAVPHQ